MRIAVIGWYGHGNAGDERILYCLKRFFADHGVVPINGFAGMREHAKEINRCDYVLFGGGGQILRGTGKHAPLFADLRPPFACVGISVEASHQDNVDLLSVIKDKAEFILVRDAGSRELFDRHPKVIVGPDLTFLYPFEVAETVPTDQCGVNFREWRYWKAEHNGNYDHWMRRLNRRFPALRKLYPLPNWRPDKVIALLRNNFATLLPISLYNEPSRVTDADELRRFFDHEIADFSAQQIANCRVLVAMRLHALIFACQIGTPFVSLSYMPKNVEFCKSIGLQEYSVDLFNLSQLKSALTRIKAGHATVRSHLLEAREKNHQEITSLLQQLMGNPRTTLLRASA